MFSHLLSAGPLWRFRGLLSAAVGVLALTACTVDGEEAVPNSLPFAEQTPAITTPPTSIVLPSTTTTWPTLPTRSCVAQDFSVNYPETWSIGGPAADQRLTIPTDEEIDQCTWLSRGPLSEVSSDEFVPEIRLVMERRYEDQLAATLELEERNQELVNSDAFNVNGYPATLFDLRTRDGVLRTRVVVVRSPEGRGLVATATEATTGEPGNYDETLAIFGSILDSLIIID